MTKKPMAAVAEHYDQKLRKHSSSPAGVDWTEAQQTDRFFQVLRLFGQDRKFTLNDFGCGYGALYDFLKSQSFDVSYSGYDISKAQVLAAQKQHQADPCFEVCHSGDILKKADYTVASGTFNIKLEADPVEWKAFVFEALDQMYEMSIKGMAFNVKSAWSDEEYKKKFMFYADPAEFLNHCRLNYSRDVSLLHDYGHYDFTMIVRREKR